MRYEMGEKQNTNGNIDLPVQIIEGKEYQGRTTKKKCIDGFIHILTVDVYCCPFEEIIVKDEPTDVKCSS
jgi:hypothetical protein